MNSKNNIILPILGVGIIFSICLGTLDQSSHQCNRVKAIPAFVSDTPKIEKKVIINQPKETRKYRYLIEVETSPNAQVERSGNKLNIHFNGPKKETFEILSDKPLTLDEAYTYLKNNPGKCKLVNCKFYTEEQQVDNIFDYYEANREDYLSDPEDNITYSDDIFDFLED
nr:MAG: hypothetical protein [Bacteriophage sp.]